MGGLLDKANAAKEPETEAAAPAPVKTKAANTNSSPQDGGLLTKSDAIGSPDVATKISLAGWVIILVGAILSLKVEHGAWPTCSHRVGGRDWCHRSSRTHDGQHQPGQTRRQHRRCVAHRYHVPMRL